jgi:hypothetical protein
VKCAAFLLLLGACTSAPSDLKPSLLVYERRDTLFVQAYFDDDPGVDVSATFRGRTLTVAHQGGGSYGAELALESALATDEPVEMEVAGISMTITAPAAIEPVEIPLFVSRSHAETIRWNAGADPMWWYVDSRCVSGRGDIAPDTTSKTFTPADWHVHDGATCTTELTLDRYRTTEVDPAFAGGSLTFSRDVLTSFASMP